MAAQPFSTVFDMLVSAIEGTATPTIVGLDTYSAFTFTITP
jgi:hypothetical protein